jgi:phenylpropionate dioxygenase-like ring-hydroxylating dioxygenase large terminal subunit
VWYAFASESSARKEYMKICGDHDAWFHKSLLEQVEKLAEPANMNTRQAFAISRGLEGLIDGFWQECLYQPEQFDREQAKQTCYDYLDTVFPAIKKQETSPQDPVKVEKPRVSNPETSDLLPTWTYYDPEYFDLEQAEIFSKNWLAVGHISDMPERGNYLTLDAIGEQVVVIRGHDDQVRAFHNVCRHRGARLLGEEMGQCPHTLSCPFHGWTYRLDGQLIGVPAENTFEDLDKKNISLVPVEMEIWNGFVFIRLQGGGQSVAEQMAPLDSIFGPYQIENMVPVKNSRYHEIRPYNWKVIHDIDNEGYHIPVGHPSLQQLYGKSYTSSSIEDLSLSTAHINEKLGKLWSVRNYQKLLPEFDHLPQEYQRMWQYVLVFPTMIIGLYPDSIEYYMTLPLTPAETIYRGGSYALPDARREIEAVRYLNRRINFNTEKEDESYVRDMQVGRQSSVFPEQRLSSIESGVREYHHQLQRVLPVATLKNHPGAGQVSDMNSRLLNTR